MSLERKWIYIVCILVLFPVTSYAQTGLSGSSSGKLSDRVDVTGTSGSLTPTDTSRFGYRRGPFIALGAGVNGIAALNFGSSNFWRADALVLPRISLIFSAAHLDKIASLQVNLR